MSHPAQRSRDSIAAASASDHRYFQFLLIFVVHACWLYAVSGQILNDPDTFWHIKVGGDIWLSGRLPISDEYSHSFAGHPWIAKEWLSEIVLFLAHKFGGWNSVVALTVFSIALATSLLGFFLSSRLNFIVAFAISYLALFLSMQTYLARPHVFTFPIIVIWTEFLFRASENNRAPSFFLLALVPLWANLHGSFTFSIVICGLAFLNFVERTGSPCSALAYKWMLFMAACVASWFIHPYGYGPILITLNIFAGNEWLIGPGEWRAVDVAAEPLHEKVLLFLVFLLAVIGLKLRLAKALFAILMLHLFLSHVRFAYLFYYLVPLVCSFELAWQYPRLSSLSGHLGRKLVAFSKSHARAISAGMMIVYFAGTSAFVVLADARQPSDIAPQKAIDFVRSREDLGNVLNSNEFGGFLIFKDVKSFFDGRTDQLFGDEFLRKTIRSQSATGGEDLDRLLSEYKIQWTLLRPSDPRVLRLNRKPGWRREYADESAVIHVLHQ